MKNNFLFFIIKVTVVFIKLVIVVMIIKDLYQSLLLVVSVKEDILDLHP